MKLFKLNSKVDWALQLDLAKKRKWDELNPGVLIRNYSALKKIGTEYAIAPSRPNITVHVHYGITGSGKSHKVFNEVEGKEYYIKDSETKWFDGYKGEKIGVIDEFRGIINIAKILKWWDKWPCNVEIKGGQVPLEIDTWYVMSNLSPEEWYPDLDSATKDALLRRITQKTKYVFKHGENLDDLLNNIFN